MKKTEVKICMGTMCYVMGGAHLKDVVDMLPEDMRPLVEVSYSPCLGMCQHGGDPPYVLLNGKTVAGVSKAGLLQMLKAEIKK